MTRKEEAIVSYIRKHKKASREDIATVLADGGFGRSVRDAASTINQMLKSGLIKSPKFRVYTLGRVPGKSSPNQLNLL